jgi:hypothetical protein
MMRENAPPELAFAALAQSTTPVIPSLEQRHAGGGLRHRRNLSA